MDTLIFTQKTFHCAKKLISHQTIIFPNWKLPTSPGKNSTLHLKNNFLLLVSTQRSAHALKAKFLSKTTLSSITNHSHFDYKEMRREKTLTTLSATQKRNEICKGPIHLSNTPDSKNLLPCLINRHKQFFNFSGIFVHYKFFSPIFLKMIFF